MISLRYTSLVLRLATALCTGSVAAAQNRIALNLDAAIRDAALRGTVQNLDPHAAAGQNQQSLTLADATEFALAHNLDIAVERLNAPAVDFQFAGLKASYLPTVTGLFGAQRNTAVPSTLLAGGTSVLTTTSTF